MLSGVGLGASFVVAQESPGPVLNAPHQAVDEAESVPADERSKQRVELPGTREPKPGNRVTLPGGLPGEGSVEGPTEEVVGADHCLAVELTSLEGPVELDTPPRAPAPVVSLTASEFGNRVVPRSSDRHAGWLPVKYGKLTFDCDSSGFPMASAVAYYLDGRPFKTVRPTGSARVELVCPAPGRHLIQARYLDEELGWSMISEPLRFEVMWPDRPTIVSVHDACDAAGPIEPGHAVASSSGMVYLKLADVAPKARITVYINGQLIPSACCEVNCVAHCGIEVNLGAHVPPGVHEIRVRQTPPGEENAISSPVSAPVKVRYYDPGRQIGRSDQCVNKGTSPGTTSTKTQSDAVPTMSATNEACQTSAQSLDAQFVALIQEEEPAKPEGKPTDIPGGSGDVPSDPRAAEAYAAAQAKAAEARAAADAAAAQARYNSESLKARAEADADAARAKAESDRHAAEAKARADALIEQAKSQGEIARWNAEAEKEKARLALETTKVQADASIRISRGWLGTVLEFMDKRFPVGGGKERGPTPASTDGKEEKSVEKPVEKCQTFQFHSVAHFPDRQFALRGEEVEREGLLIYEGMSLTFEPSGLYTLQYRTTTPSLQTTLRLQFVVTMCDGTHRTITLPPQKVAGAYDGRRESNLSDGQCFTVTGKLSGVSPCEILEVRREGTARFGYDRAQVSTTWKQ